VLYPALTPAQAAEVIVSHTAPDSAASLNGRSAARPEGLPGKSGPA
jgi:hypothetical protein